MILFKNIIVKFTNEVLMMNLISQRRELISYSELGCLISIDSKLKKGSLELTDEERLIYESLIAKKQILDDEIIKEFDEDLYNIRKRHLEKYTYNISKSIQINITEECNFDCIYCYQKNYRKNRKLCVEDIKSIKNLCDNYIKQNNYINQIEKVVISGGESLLQSNIPIIHEIANTFSYAKLELLSNGVNLFKYFSQLPISHIESIQISLDGDDNTISGLMPTGKPLKVFDSIIDGIKLVLDNGIKVTVNSMINKETMSNLNEFIEILKAHDILDKIELIFTTAFDFNSDIDVNKSLYDDFDKLVDWYKILNDLTKQYSNIRINGIRSLGGLIESITRDVSKRPIYKIYRCNRTELPLIFAADKKIYWCTKTCDDVGYIGEFGDNAYIDIDRIKAIIDRGIYSMDSCKHCDFRYICIGGCILYSFKGKDSFNAHHCGCLNNSYIIDNIDKLIFR